jgi:hypothetical protein
MTKVDGATEEMKKDEVINHPAKYLHYADIVNTGEKQLLAELKKRVKQQEKVIRDINEIKAFFEYRNKQKSN